MFKNLIGLAIALSMTMLAAPVVAQDYPNKTVRIVVPFAAGGSTDIVARVIVEGLSQELKQSFTVDNRPGAGGAIGTDLVVKSKPDGYTLGIVGTGSIHHHPVPRFQAGLQSESRSDGGRHSQYGRYPARGPAGL